MNTLVIFALVLQEVILFRFLILPNFPLILYDFLDLLSIKSGIFHNRL